MDSLTQFTLGAAVSALCLGKVLGPRRAAILGGVLGTIPDLDVFLPFDDPVDAFVLHRGWTHSLFVHIAA
ncbi:MAG: metal-dependent hydrolase, partial [Roseibium sp.]